MKNSEILEQLKNLSDDEKREILSIISRSLIQGELSEDFDREELTENALIVPQPLQ